MSGVNRQTMDKAAELFGWAYGLGGFDVAVVEFVKFVRAQVLQQLAPELERYDIQGGDGNGVYPDKDKDGEWCKAEDALAGYAVRDARIAELNNDVERLNAVMASAGNSILELRAELAAIKAQEPVAWPDDKLIELAFTNFGGKWNGDLWTIEDANLHPFVRSFAAPVSEAKAQGVVMPDPVLLNVTESLRRFMNRFGCGETRDVQAMAAAESRLNGGRHE